METRLPESETDAVHRCVQHKHPDERFCALAETLLWRNQAVAGLLDGVNGPAGGLTEGQLAFATVAMLDLQVPDGGLLQFFWNCPEWVDDVPASLLAIGLPSLADAFARSTAALVAQIGTFSEFRKKHSLAAYSECARKFDFEDFDAVFYEQQDQIHNKSIAFFSMHLEQFVALRSSRP